MDSSEYYTKRLIEMIAKDRIVVLWPPEAIELVRSSIASVIADTEQLIETLGWQSVVKLHEKERGDVWL